MCVCVCVGVCWCVCVCVCAQCFNRTKKTVYVLVSAFAYLLTPTKPGMRSKNVQGYDKKLNLKIIKNKKQKSEFAY